MMATTPRYYRSRLHPLHAMLLAGALPLFLGAALCDYVYSTSFHIQWATFASWLLAGGLVFAGLALLCAIIGLFRKDNRRGRAVIYTLLLVVTWGLGFINALIHARDAWAMMPTGLILSIVVSLLALIATVIGFSRPDTGGRS